MLTLPKSTELLVAGRRQYVGVSTAVHRGRNRAEKRGNAHALQKWHDTNSLDSTTVPDVPKSGVSSKFHAEGRADIYAWMDRALRQQDYGKASRETNGVLRRYLIKMTGLSRAQVTRLISPVPRDPHGPADSISTASLWSALHDRGCGPAGGSRPSPRAFEWSSNLRHLETRARGVRG